MTKQEEKILLSPEEKVVILKQCRHNGETLVPKLLDEITKAQAKKFTEWGEEPCPHVSHHRGKHWCGECWQDLLEEVKND